MSEVEIDRASPGLGAVLLSHANPVRMTLTAYGRWVGVVEREFACMAAHRQSAPEHPEVDPARRKGSRLPVVELAQLDLELDHRRVEPKCGTGWGIDADGEPVVIAGRVRHPGDARARQLPDSLFRILHRVGRSAGETGALTLDVSAPRGQSTAPAPPRAGPGDAVSVRSLERFAAIRRHRLDEDEAP